MPVGDQRLGLRQLMTSVMSKVDLVQHLVPVLELDEALQHEFVRQGQLVQLRRGEVLFRAGERDRHTFYLLEGEIWLQESGQPAVVLQGGDERARHPVAQEQPRNATALAL